MSAVHFNQGYDLIQYLDVKKHDTLLEIVKKRGGLCDLVCNRILVDDVLGYSTPQNNLIKKNVTVKSMNEEWVKKSHILDVYSLFRKVIAFLFSIYPDNIFSIRDQWNLVNKVSTPFGFSQLIVNEKLLYQGLSKIQDNETLKLEVFSKGCCSLVGHSLLLKKVFDDNYIFFDPNTGEHSNLSLKEICVMIGNQLDMFHGTDIFLTKGRNYIRKLHDKMGESVFQNSLPNQLIPVFG